MSSTFGTITTVRLGIYAAQKGLDVTGNNITNINTNGYTRQRLDQISLVTSASDKYGSQYKARVGQGPVLTGISQLRDPGMDISYRKANSDVGSADQMLAGLEDLAGILDEVGKGDGEQDDGVILNQLNDLRDLINQALTNGIEDYEGSIRASANALCTQFHQYAKALEGLMEDYESQFDEDTTRVNQILTELRDVNLQIRNSDVRGDAALELRDKRNLLLDELSGYMKIDVTYSMVDAGGGYMVEEMSVKLADKKPDTFLVQGEYAAQIGTTGQADGYKVNVYALRNKDSEKKDPNATDPVTLGDNDLYGSLQSLRELLTEEGEYASADDIKTDPNAASKRGIPYYIHQLDNLARTFAEEMNKLNTVPAGTNIDGAGDLFASNDAKNPNITAGNISISQEWAEGTVKMLSTRDPNAPTDDRSNLAAFLNLFNKKDITFDLTNAPGAQNPNGTPYEGSFESMLLRIESTLAQDQMAATTTVSNYAITLNNVYTDRDSITGVDLNDEATSLMVYQKAYTAACRVLTTLEEAIDTLLNATA